MSVDGRGKREKEDPELREPVLERRRDGDAVQDRIDRDASEALLLLKRNPELRIQVPDLRIEVLEAVHRLLRLRSGVVDDVLIVDRRIGDVRPLRLFHREPVTGRPQTPLEEPIRPPLLSGNEPDEVLVGALWGGGPGEDGNEAGLVLLPRPLLLG